jgi:hypothetical protein
MRGVRLNEISESVVIIIFQMFFTRKYIKIIFKKYYFRYQHIKTTQKHKKKIILSKKKLKS